MSNRPFRFVHAADFHLETPPSGVTEVPDHLRELFIESAYLAAERVFETVLSEQADLLVLAGDLLDPRHTGPRGPLFLAEQFERLAQRNVVVYWAGGRVDPPDAWPSSVRLPDNVHVFPRGRPEECIHSRDGAPLARLLGASRGRGEIIRTVDFDPDPGRLFSIAVTHGTAEPDALQSRGIEYWALGGRHERSTPLRAPCTAHYPGSPQGRRPGQCGPHGCTLVQVDQQRQVRSTLMQTDVMRWHDERIMVDQETTREDLEILLRERMQTLMASSPDTDLLVAWTVAGTGETIGGLRRGAGSAELLEWLRAEFGSGPPAAWSVSLKIESTDTLPAEWFEQETIRGDFLRAIRQYEVNGDASLELESYLADEQLAGTLSFTADLPDGPARREVLSQAATLGVDLLSGEESRT